MSDQVEHELTFLATDLPPELTASTPERIVDVYVPSDPAQHPRLRLRRRGERFELTKKLPVRAGDASAHRELTIPLTAEEFEELAVGDRRVEKVRHQAEVQGHRVEVDVFTGALAGLVLIDVEFGSRAELLGYAPPDFFGPDVTQEDLIAGGLLAGRRFADIAPDLEQLLARGSGRG